MRSTNELLSYLHELDIKLWVEQGRLRFNAPQNVMTPEIKAEIASHKVDLLELLSQNIQISAPIPVISRQQNLGLSFTQQRLWFLYQLDPDSAAYQLRYNLQLTGILQLDILDQSLTEITRRHEILRTNFSQIDGNPFQIIHPPQAIASQVVDLQAFLLTEQKAEVHRLANQEAQTAFNLEKDALLRITLLRLAPENHILLITLHHIIADAWTIGLFLRELSSLYKSFLEAKPSPLPELPIQYVDFAHWQNHHLTKDKLVDQMEYWRQQLANIPPVLELPTDYPRPPVQKFRGGAEFFEISASLTEQLQSLSQKSGVTLFMTIVTAFFILLSRYTGQEDIVIGVPIANRLRVEVESLMGCFVNTLVLRSQLHGQPTFLELLQQVRQNALEAYANQDLPFEQLVEALQPERLLSHSPLFQVMFAWENVQIDALELPNLKVTPLRTDHFTAKADLNVEMMETDRGIQGIFEFNTDLFDAATIKRMVENYQTLLEGIVLNPEQRVSELPILTSAERHQILEEWNRTKTEYPRDSTIQQLFETQVEKTPDCIAIIYGNQQITYHQLNQRANQLAHHLRTLGVGSDELVGICLERSIDLIIGLLGILKAGGAYVPLDAENPQERIALMLSDAQVSVLLTQNSLLDKLPTHQTQIICLDTEWKAIANSSPKNPDNITTADNLAYIVYTSGSTGKPKGVAVSHRAVNRLVLNTDYIQLSPHECIAQASNVSFDAATFEIWGALLSGARLVGITKEVALSPQRLATQIRQDRITTLFLTTALFNQIARQVPDAFQPLSNLLFGGEAVDPSAVREVLSKGLPRRMLHVYGPTENTTFSSWYLVQSISAKATTIPIGCPIANSQIYILDAQLQPLPIGVPGELHIGGDGLAQGYFNQPELTAEKFIPNPFGAGRLYKTGDLTRYLADGNIEFLGRIDLQVKIRGFRIELGEIEAVLAQYPDIREVAVIAREDQLRDKRLVAYVLAKPEITATPRQLQQFLKEKLPDYMIPSTFVVLDIFPLTPSGKVDRRALPVPSSANLEWDHEFIAPSNPIESLIADIWAKCLGIEQVGIYDNFFDIGGNSLLMIQVHSGLQKTLNQDISVVDLFKYPTINALAQFLSQGQDDEHMTIEKSRDRAEKQKQALKRNKLVVQQRRKGNA